MFFFLSFFPLIYFLNSPELIKFGELIKCVYLFVARLVASSIEEATEQFCSCRSTIELTCLAPAEPGVLYRSVRWYKVSSRMDNQSALCIAYLILIQCGMSMQMND